MIHKLNHSDYLDKLYKLGCCSHDYLDIAEFCAINYNVWLHITRDESNIKYWTYTICIDNQYHDEIKQGLTFANYSDVWYFGIKDLIDYVYNPQNTAKIIDNSNLSKEELEEYFD